MIKLCILLVDRENRSIKWMLVFYFSHLYNFIFYLSWLDVCCLCCVVRAGDGDVSGAGAGAGQCPCLVSGRRQVFLMDGSSIPHCQCQCHPRLLQNSQHLHQKSILSIALLPPQSDEGRAEGKFGQQSKTLEPSLNPLTQSFRKYFSIYFVFVFLGIKSSFQYCFPRRQPPGLLHWLIWMVPEEDRVWGPGQ